MEDELEEQGSSVDGLAENTAQLIHSYEEILSEVSIWGQVGTPQKKLRGPMVGGAYQMLSI